MSFLPAKSPGLYFGALVAGYLVFIGIASFYLTGNIPSTEFSMGNLFSFDGGFRFRLHNLRDISTNILLYMPLGFLLAMYISCSRRIPPFSFHLCWGILLSVCVEITQGFIGRYSDITDVLSNGTGFALGFLIARLSVSVFGVKPASLLGQLSTDKSDALNTLTGIRFVYVSITFLTCLLPLDITVSLTDIFGKLSADGNGFPRLIVNPLFHFQMGMEHLQYLVLKLLMFLPLAFLSAHIQMRRHRSSILIPAFHCLMLGLSVELSNLFILSGRTDVFILILGFFTGLVVAIVLLQFNRERKPVALKASGEDQRYFFYSAALLYCLLLLVIALSPFDFELSLNAIKTKLVDDSNFIPFYLHFSTRSIGSAIDIVREVILYAPLGALITFVGQSSNLKQSMKLTLTLSTVLVGIYAGVLELFQLAVIGRYVDVTDCLLAGVGGFGGAVMAPLFGIENAASTNE